jgi:hypothetical protein
MKREMITLSSCPLSCSARWTFSKDGEEQLRKGDVGPRRAMGNRKRRIVIEYPLYVMQYVIVVVDLP